MASGEVQPLEESVGRALLSWMDTAVCTKAWMAQEQRDLVCGHLSQLAAFSKCLLGHSRKTGTCEAWPRFQEVLLPIIPKAEQ